MGNENSFVFYETFIDTIEQAEQFNKGLEMAKAIINYGLYHDEPVPSSDNAVVVMGLAQIKNDIDRAQLRRAEQIENGKMGGRPTKGHINDAELHELVKNGASQQDAAKFYGVSVRTIQRHLANAKESVVPRESIQSQKQGVGESAAARSSDPGTGTWEF